MSFERTARLGATAIVAGMSIATLVWGITDLHFNDLESYRDAALRVREGGQLYGGEVTPFNKYYYAPWFAFAFTPLSYLSWPVLAAVWTTTMVASSVVVARPLLDGSRSGVLLAALFGSVLVALSLSGNVHALMLAGLRLLLPTRYGPFAVGIAASLKGTPILLAIAYVARREWRSAAVSVAIATTLWAPIAVFDLAPVTFDSGGAALEMPLWLTTAGIGALAATAAAVRWPTYAWVAAAVATYLATPRLYVYDMTVILVAAGVTLAEQRCRHAPGMGRLG